MANQANDVKDATPSRMWIPLLLAGIALAAALGFAVWRTQSAGTPQAATAGGQPNEPAAVVAAAQAHFDNGDYAAAATGYRRATQLAPGVASNWSALGEALVMASRDGQPVMPDEALAAFNRAVGLDPKDPRARYFLAVKKDLDGDHAGAITAWLALLADTPKGAPWEADLKRTIEQVGQRHNIAVTSRIATIRQPEAAAPPVAAQAIPGPTRQQMQDASALPKGQQDMMIEGMIASLEGKLRDNPAQPDRWIMLMRSRMTLGEPAKARTALDAAIAANPAATERLRAEARLLGVPGA